MSKRAKGLSTKEKRQVIKLLNNSHEVKSFQDSHADTSLVASAPLQSNFLIDEGAGANERNGHLIKMKELNFALVAYNDESANSLPSIVRVVCARNKQAYAASWTGFVPNTYGNIDREDLEILYDQTKVISIDNPGYFKYKRSFKQPRILEYDSTTGGSVLPGRQYAVFIYTNETTANQVKINGHLQLKYIDP